MKESVMEQRKRLVSSLLLPINTISSFKSIITNIVGTFSSVHQMLRSDSLNDQIVTKPKELKNTAQKTNDVF